VLPICLNLTPMDSPHIMPRHRFPLFILPRSTTSGQFYFGSSSTAGGSRVGRVLDVDMGAMDMENILEWGEDDGK